MENKALKNEQERALLLAEKWELERQLKGLLEKRDFNYVIDMTNIAFRIKQLNEILAMENSGEVEGKIPPEDLKEEGVYWAFGAGRYWLVQVKNGRVYSYTQHDSYLYSSTLCANSYDFYVRLNLVDPSGEEFK